MDVMSDEYRKYQKLVMGKNINPNTLLATDYLNHFNEIHMLLGMIADMPDCLEDILEWESISYQDHFRNSVFQDKILAIEAFNHSPEKYKIPFKSCIAQMDELLLNTISLAENAIKSHKHEEVVYIISDYTPKMERLIEECSSIINSQETTTQQDAIDDIFENDGNASAEQAAIDNLFG